MCFTLFWNEQNFQICFFTLLVVAFAAPKADPIIPLTYTAGTPLTYSYSSPIAYADYGYGLSPYAAGYYGNYGYGLPLAYRNLYIWREITNFWKCGLRRRNNKTLLLIWFVQLLLNCQLKFLIINFVFD